MSTTPNQFGIGRAAGYVVAQLDGVLRTEQEFIQLSQQRVPEKLFKKSGEPTRYRYRDDVECPALRRLAKNGLILSEKGQDGRVRYGLLEAIANASPEAADLEPPPPGRVQVTISRIVRDTALANSVKRIHEFNCQICGDTLVLADGSKYAEGHHLQPLGTPHNGPDVSGNIVCLCPNHHALCDFRAVRLSAAVLLQSAGHVVDAQYISYHNQLVDRNNEEYT